jgi:hypothetical protein
MSELPKQKKENQPIKETVYKRMQRGLLLAGALSSLLPQIAEPSAEAQSKSEVRKVKLAEFLEGDLLPEETRELRELLKQKPWMFTDKTEMMYYENEFDGKFIYEVPLPKGAIRLGNKPEVYLVGGNKTMRNGVISVEGGEKQVKVEVINIMGGKMDYFLVNNFEDFRNRSSQQITDKAFEKSGIISEIKMVVSRRGASTMNATAGAAYFNEKAFNKVVQPGELSFIRHFGVNSAFGNLNLLPSVIISGGGYKIEPGGGFCTVAAAAGAGIQFSQQFGFTDNYQSKEHSDAWVVVEKTDSNGQKVRVKEQRSNKYYINPQFKILLPNGMEKGLRDTTVFAPKVDAKANVKKPFKTNIKIETMEQMAKKTTDPDVRLRILKIVDDEQSYMRNNVIDPLKPRTLPNVPGPTIVMTFQVLQPNATVEDTRAENKNAVGILRDSIQRGTGFTFAPMFK